MYLPIYFYQFPTMSDISLLTELPWNVRNSYIQKVGPIESCSQWWVQWPIIIKPMYETVCLSLKKLISQPDFKPFLQIQNFGLIKVADFSSPIYAARINIFSFLVIKPDWT